MRIAYFLILTVVVRKQWKRFQNSERIIFNSSTLNHVINQMWGTIKDIFLHAIKNLLTPTFPGALLEDVLYWNNDKGNRF